MEYDGRQELPLFVAVAAAVGCSEAFRLTSSLVELRAEENRNRSTRF